MKKISLRRFELTISLLRKLSQVVDVRLASPETLGNDRSSRLRPVDEGRLRPAIIPIRSSCRPS
jgi:hypothetical protein